MQATILFSGTVQGVGFRYTTLNYARDIELKGCVKNLSDGRVEICAQGSKRSIENLVKQLQKHFQGYVTGHQINFADIENQWTDFKIV